MKIGIGNDHTAIDLKEIIVSHLKEKGYECIDFGTNERGVSCDYPKYGQMVAEAINDGKIEKGILICGTGIGISLAANKVKNIRAAVCSEPYSAHMAAMHNDANIIAFGARVVGSDMAKMIVDEFLNTRYEGGRHQKRVDMIRKIEDKYNK